MDSTYLERLLSWRRQKDDDLRRRDSWLTLAGLHWLAEGRQTAGAAASGAVRLPPPFPGPPGGLGGRGGQVFSHRAPSLPLDGPPPQGDPLQADTAEEPTFLRVGDSTLVVIE